MPRPSPTTTKPASTPEAQRAGLVITRDNLLARQAAVASEVEAALAARRKALIDGGSAADIADAEKACREIEGTAFGITDALAEIDRRIAATEERIAADLAAAEREAAAAGLDRDGAAIDAAAERVRRAVEALAQAGEALAAAITPTAVPLFDLRDMHGQRDSEPPERLAAFLIGHMIATAIPLVEVAEAGRQEKFGWVSARVIEPKHGAEPAKALLTEPMRVRAAAIRDGDAAPTLARYERPEPDFSPDREEIEVYVTQPFTYVRKTGYLAELCSVRRQRIPTPVAEVAIRQGVATRDEPGNWAGTLERARGRLNGVEIADIPALGFNLEEWREAETQRRRNAWLAEQRQAA